MKDVITCYGKEVDVKICKSCEGIIKIVSTGNLLNSRAKCPFCSKGLDSVLKGKSYKTKKLVYSLGANNA